MITAEEKEVMSRIVEAHNLFVKLPIQHPFDNSEWVSIVHQLQRIIMSRVAVRANPEIYLNNENHPKGS